MMIRKAKVGDSKAIAPLLLLAMKEIVFHFIGMNSIDKATQFLETLICKRANQYSYENCWVTEDKEGIVAVVNIYDGAQLHKLRTPVILLLKSMFNRDFIPEDETHEGEIYIDCIGVRQNRQGEGIGSEMLQFLITEYSIKRNKTLGLLVDKNNPNAKRLYLKLGFEIVDKMTLAGEAMEHLQLLTKKA